jgi:membrane protease YdiL (CAAX protease family)
VAIGSKPADSSVLSTGPNLPRSPRSAGANIFVGPNGIRAGWRLLMFLAIFAALAATFHFTLHHIPAVGTWQESLPKDSFVPSALLVGESLQVLILIISALIMSKIERKTFTDYGLPFCQAFAKRFWQGVPFGLAMLSLLMALIAALHGFSISGIALSATAAVKYGVLYGIAFTLVGLFEEFSFRGYMQATLGSGMGFWPAAIVLSLMFGAIHLRNSGEAISGAVMAGSFGLLAAFSLRRIGNIWFAIGMHASFDWGETFLYSVSDSGLPAKGHLLNSSVHGSFWLTGGSVGPEGSGFAILVLLIGALAIHLVFPAKYPHGVNCDP